MLRMLKAALLYAINMMTALRSNLVLFHLKRSHVSCMTGNIDCLSSYFGGNKILLSLELVEILIQFRAMTRIINAL